MNENEFKLSEEDKIRMKRLSQEILGRLTEMNMIIASTMNLTANRFSEAVFKLPENGDPMEIKFSSSDELIKSGVTTMGCGVYRDPPGTCSPCFPL